MMKALALILLLAAVLLGQQESVPVTLQQVRDIATATGAEQAKTIFDLRLQLLALSNQLKEAQDKAKTCEAKLPKVGEKKK